MTMTAALALVSEVVGRDLSPRRLPSSLVSPLAALVELGAKISRRRAPFCREMARVVKHENRYDGSLATRELGLIYTPVESTVRRTVDWFRLEGLLDGGR